MTQRHNLLVVIGTYNEMENLPGLLDEIWSAVPSANVLIVDDDSPDGTGTWCENLQQTESRVHVIHRKNIRGLGSAIVAGLNWGIEHGYEMIGTMDADFSHPPEYLPAMIDDLHFDDDSADVVVGSRYCEGGKIVGWPWYRRISSRVLNATTRAILRLPPHDTSGNYRLYRACVLSPGLLKNVHSEGYAYLEELLWLLHQDGVEMQETPITFVERRAGRSKVSLLEPFHKLGVIIRLAFAKPAARIR